MVKHESRRRRHIKTNLDKKWIILQSTHLQNEPCIHLVSAPRKFVWRVLEWRSNKQNTQFPGPVPHALLCKSYLQFQLYHLSLLTVTG
jgi:hypothetical protein